MTGTAPSGVLTVNAGSSSIKAAVFDAGGDEPRRLARGEVAGIRKQASLVTVAGDGETDSVPLPGVRDHDDAMAPLLEWVRGALGGLELAAVGHRIVHGGDRYTGPVEATPEILDDLDTLAPLAPMHQPVGLNAVRVLGRLLPGVPQILSFDTAFHATMPALARAFALPRELTAEGIRRYGFHGLSYEAVARRLPEYLGATAAGRVVVAHLGSGASLCALRAGRSVATTMGLTPLDGLPMGTRCGALDPGVVLHLLRERGLSVDQVEDLLYHRSGLFGVSGVSGRMEFLLKAATPAADAAVDLFVHRTAAEIAAMASALGGLDALVFTAGVGEGSAEIRRRIGARCRWLGVELDQGANDGGGPRITTPESPVSAWVIPTDEEGVIARQAIAVLRGTVGPRPSPAEPIRTASLPGGRYLTVRRVTPDDADQLARLYDGLDDDDRYRRFFSLYRPDRATVERWAADNEHGKLRLGAFVEEGDPGTAPRLVGDALCVPLPDGDGEFALAVEAEWRGWLGAYLLDTLAEVAAAQGLRNLQADILTDNGRMLAVVRARGHAVLGHPDYNEVRVTTGTGPTTPDWPGSHDRPRILVEARGSRSALHAQLAGGGFQVITCPGPERRCPVLAGQPCPLVAGADAVVFALPAGDPDAAALAAGHARLHPGVPLCVVDRPGGWPSGLPSDVRHLSSAALVDDLRSGLEPSVGRRDS